MRLIFQLVRLGYGWQDIAGRVGDPNPDNVKRRFYRWVEKNRERVNFPGAFVRHAL